MSALQMLYAKFTILINCKMLRQVPDWQGKPPNWKASPRQEGQDPNMKGKPPIEKARPLLEKQAPDWKVTIVYDEMTFVFKRIAMYSYFS